MDMIQNEAWSILNLYKDNHNSDIILNSQEQETYDNASECIYCNESLDEKVKVRDHCHVTGKFRGAPRNVPIAFHNLKGYDSHLIIKNLQKNYGKITCIPNTEEKYMSFTIGPAKFIDTFQFLSSRLTYCTMLHNVVHTSPCTTLHNVAQCVKRTLYNVERLYNVGQGGSRFTSIQVSR
eukprot:Lithocolla_globosa_v1_NODE_1901_length_2266_cov_255.919493.p2 type:complete len:179 gc:universal NODE_1901_length_2266_cov_255.919493:1414-878(-)